MSSKEYYNNTRVVANYTRTIAQMFQVIWTGEPIPAESIAKNVSGEYMSMAKKIVDLETKLSRASPDPDRAQEITVCL